MSVMTDGAVIQFFEEFIPRLCIFARKEIEYSYQRGFAKKSEIESRVKGELYNLFRRHTPLTDKTTIAKLVLNNIEIIKLDEKGEIQKIEFCVAYSSHYHSKTLDLVNQLNDCLKKYNPDYGNLYYQAGVGCILSDVENKMVNLAIELSK